MKILLDECLPKGLAKALKGHDVKTAPQMGWAGVSNGKLLQFAADASFEGFITVDQNISHQTDIKNLHIALLVLRADTNRLEDILPFTAAILSLIDKGVSPQIYVLECSGD